MNNLTIKQLQLPNDKEVIYLDGEALSNYAPWFEIIDILTGTELGLIRT